MLNADDKLQKNLHHMDIKQFRFATWMADSDT